MISMMRVLSPSTTVENADKVARMIVNTYLTRNKTFPQCATWSTSARSICCMILVKPAVKSFRCWSIRSGYTALCGLNVVDMRGSPMQRGHGGPKED
jgi:hypothetical protein